MPFNPFEEKAPKIENTLEDWSMLYVKPYDKKNTDAYTKIRIILAAAAEYEAVWFTHQFHRNCCDNDIRRTLALLRRIEQQQQKKLASLKPLDETSLETTISYEQLAVELTAQLARAETNKHVKAALDFGLCEDFDHLYRFAGLLEMEQGIAAKTLVSNYTEIMPGRPTISEHRFPFDDIKRSIPQIASTLQTKLSILLITAAEQQTMNYYMNMGGYYTSALGRKLFAEIAMIEEQHVTHYGSLLDCRATWLERLLLHEYSECYLYYSLFRDETDNYVKRLWESLLNQELAHVQTARALLNRYENRDYNEIVGDGSFPALLSFNESGAENRRYVRHILKHTISNTAMLEDYVSADALPQDYQFFSYNAFINKSDGMAASHKVIDNYIAEFGEDYRYADSEHPVKELRNRKQDNTEIGRIIKN